MRATFILLPLLLFSPSVFAHEHTNALPEIDRKFLDNLQRPDNRPDERFSEKSKSCCTDKDAVRTEYKMVIPEGTKYPEPEWYVWIALHNPDGSSAQHNWVRVPPEKIVDEYSPSGQALRLPDCGHDPMFRAPTDTVLRRDVGAAPKLKRAEPPEVSCPYVRITLLAGCIISIADNSASRPIARWR
jgi:hypothetical protein